MAVTVAEILLTAMATVKEQHAKTKSKTEAKKKRKEKTQSNK